MLFNLAAPKHQNKSGSPFVRSFMRAEKNKKIINAQTSRRSRRPKMPQFAVPFEDGRAAGKCIAAWEGEGKDPTDMLLDSIVAL